MNALYHYCPSSAFISIVESKSIWLSSLKLSNDAMEGKMIKKILTEIAEEDSLDNHTRTNFELTLGFFDDLFDALGLCFSERSDLLSQWRGYADDGNGVSIGFSKSYLEKLKSSYRVNDENKLSLEKVEYNPEVNKSKLLKVYQELKPYLDAGAYKTAVNVLLFPKSAEELKAENLKYQSAATSIFKILFRLYTELFTFKNKAFDEELEWRLVSYIVKAFEEELHYKNCNYRMSMGRILPYFVLELPDLGEPIILEVVIGPKNETPIEVVEAMLVQHGFTNVKTRRSEASYR